ncbi:Palmitoyltransferase, DHHC domain [Dillenia turbinata]|uniref:S-acyltransferase n=1 Tax=Dillenia turbinata TaxID=194707 RepID=A0AAN8ZDP1_9MAGN
MKFKKFLSIPIISVFSLMGFAYYITIFIFIQDWLGLESSSGFRNALIFSFFAFLSLFSFFVCVIRDPGHVPSSYVPDVEYSPSTDQDSTKSVSHSRRCDKCSSYKPPRAHHCRVCRRCVLRMDHHCLWINNCVGYRNYKGFLTLVLYTTVASIHSMVIVVSSGLQKDFTGRPPLKIFYISCGALMVALSFTLGTLLGWHIYLLAHNLTTIEYYEGKRAAWLARKSGQGYRHPYNVGDYKNITLVCLSLSLSLSHTYTHTNGS